MEIHEWPIINLLSFLHLQNPIGDFFLSSNVPDTILYENSIPRQWFFSKQQQVKMKSRMKLDDAYIKQYFTEELNQEIVCIWRTKTEIQILNKEALIKFFDQDGQKNGILQRFVYPRGKYNFSILIQWSQSQTLFEKYQSLFQLNDQTVDIYQRGLTFERDQTLSQQLNSKSLTERLEHFCSSIGSHAQTLIKLKSKIIRMNIEVKIDNNDMIWLINCTLIKWSSSEQAHMKQLSLPNFIDQEKLILKQYKNVLKDSQCEMCDKNYHKSDLMKTKIKNIIESWNFDHMGDNDKLLIAKSKQIILMRKKTMAEKLDLKQDVELRQVSQNYLIPLLIRKIFPKLKYIQYKELLGNPGFLEMEFNVCYECHIKIDKGVNVSQDLGKLAKQEMLCPASYRGIQKLRPEINQERFLTTRREILKKISSSSSSQANYRKYTQTPSTTGVYNSTNTSRIIGISPIKSMLNSLLPKQSQITYDTKLGKNTPTRTHSRRVSDLK